MPGMARSVRQMRPAAQVSEVAHGLVARAEDGGGREVDVREGARGGTHERGHAREGGGEWGGRRGETGEQVCAGLALRADTRQEGLERRIPFRLDGWANLEAGDIQQQGAATGLTTQEQARLGVERAEGERDL